MLAHLAHLKTPSLFLVSSQDIMWAQLKLVAFFRQNPVPLVSCKSRLHLSLFHGRRSCTLLALECQKKPKKAVNNLPPCVHGKKDNVHDSILPVTHIHAPLQLLPTLFFLHKFLHVQLRAHSILIGLISLIRSNIKYGNPLNQPAQ